MPPKVPTHDSTLQGESYERYRRFETLPELVKGGTVEPRWEDGDTFVFADRSTDPPTVYRVDPVENTMVAAPGEDAPAERPLIPALAAALTPGPYESPDGRFAVAAEDHDLALTCTSDGRVERLTETGTEEVFWAPARGALGTLDATWAPNSARLVAVLADTTGVSRSPVVHWLKAREEIEWRVMPRPGERAVRSTLHIVDVVSKATVPIEGTGLEDHTYYPVGWHPDGTEYFLLRMDRRMQTLDLLAADARTGASRVVVRDTSATFIAGLDFFIRFGRYVRVVGDDRILWISERDGWDHLYLYDRDGTLVRRLTEGAFPVHEVLEVDEESGWVYFTAQPDAARPYDVHLCRVHLDGSGYAQLTEGAGSHHPWTPLFVNETRVAFTPSKQYFLTTWSSVTEPPRTELRSADGTLLRVLTTASIDALVESGWTPPEEFVAKAADGETDLHGIICRPPAFDRECRYPVLDHIYNGPFVSWVPHTFLGALKGQGQALAQGGFVVVVVDGRGTTGRGKAFQDVVYMSWGRHEIADHETAIRAAAASRPYMDLDRVGIFGGSWGGYMTQRGLLQAPDFYKVGVSSAPVADLYDHTFNLEWYVGLPQDNREVYDYASNLRLVDQLKGKLLLIHGTSDLANAPFSSTMKLVDALIRAGKQFDLAVVPEMGHGPERDDHKRFYADLHFRYLTDHLGVVTPPGSSKSDDE